MLCDALVHYTPLHSTLLHEPLINQIMTSIDSLDLLVGEVYIKNEDFDTINENRRLSNETVFSTARNAAAGSLRNLGNLL